MLSDVGDGGAQFVRLDDSSQVRKSVVRAEPACYHVVTTTLHAKNVFVEFLIYRIQARIVGYKEDPIQSIFKKISESSKF